MQVKEVSDPDAEQSVEQILATAESKLLAGSTGEAVQLIKEAAKGRVFHGCVVLAVHG